MSSPVIANVKFKPLFEELLPFSFGKLF